MPQAPTTLCIRAVILNGHLPRPADSLVSSAWKGVACNNLGSEELQRVWRDILADTAAENGSKACRGGAPQGLSADELLKGLSRRNWSACGSCCKSRPKQTALRPGYRIEDKLKLGLRSVGAARTPEARLRATMQASPLLETGIGRTGAHSGEPRRAAWRAARDRPRREGGLRFTRHPPEETQHA